MANFYRHEKMALGSLVAAAGAGNAGGATILIPDLQRPYVWNPSQVVLLIDSIIRGWPFGTLLLWKLPAQDLGRFPNRNFNRVVDRTSTEGEAPIDMRVPPADYLLVLDGQQRLQSLLLAIGGDGWGFKLEDTDWARLQGRKTQQTAHGHWSMASLCFDLQAFLEEFDAKPAGAIAVDYTKVLKWLIVNPTGGQSAFPKPKTYEEVLPRLFAEENRGRFVRLSRLWQEVPEDPNLRERQYREMLGRLLEEWAVAPELRPQLMDALPDLMTLLRDVKTSDVSFLLINEFTGRDVREEHAYNDAIVNIFTRLNTAGRTLTREEITMAWLKSGWREAGASFEALRDAMQQEGLPLEMDELVGIVSFLWAIQYRDGNLLENKDLLDSSIIKPMATDLSRDWKILCASMGTVAREYLKERELEFGNAGRFSSVHSVSVLCAMQYMADAAIERLRLPGTQRDSAQKVTEETLRGFVDRWIFGSQWAGRWSFGLTNNVSNYAGQLSEDWKRLAASADWPGCARTLKERADSILKGIEDDACASIDGISASSRSRVSVYRNYLWVWHRLDPQRWTNTACTLKYGRRKAHSADVDHSVAFKLWEKRIEAECPGEDEETRSQLLARINCLGNCLLLEKTFNISKGMEQWDDFIPKIHEFNNNILQRDGWAQSLMLTESLMKPKSAALQDVLESLEARDRTIRQELKEFIRGTKSRVDR